MILALALDERGINHLARRSFPTSTCIEYTFETWKGERLLTLTRYQKKKMDWHVGPLE